MQLLYVVAFLHNVKNMRDESKKVAFFALMLYNSKLYTKEKLHEKNKYNYGTLRLRKK